MKDIGIVHGSARQAVPLVIGRDTVYVHTDIELVTETPDGEPIEGMFRYHEIQYAKDEYILMMAGALAKDSANIDYISMMSGIDLPDTDETEENIDV